MYNKEHIFILREILDLKLLLFSVQHRTCRRKRMLLGDTMELLEQNHLSVLVLLQLGFCP